MRINYMSVAIICYKSINYTSVLKLKCVIVTTLTWTTIQITYRRNNNKFYSVDKKYEIFPPIKAKQTQDTR